MWLLAAIVGLLIAVTELLTRYRDNPGAAMFSRWGALYMGLNMAISVSAVALTNAYQFDSFFPAGPSIQPRNDIADETDQPSGSGAPTIAAAVPKDESDTTQARAGTRPQGTQPSFYSSSVFRTLFAAFAGILLFRTVIRFGDGVIGPGQVIEVMLGYLDRNIDRARATQRIVFVVDIMRDVDFTKAADYFSLVFTGSMQRITADEQRQISAVIEGLKKIPTTNEIKCLALGFAILNWSGEGLLDALVKAGAENIKLPTGP